MLTKNEPDEPIVFTEIYSADDIRPNGRCRGHNPVISGIERALRGACEFSNLDVNLREMSYENRFFYKYCDARMFSDGARVELRLKGEYLLDDIKSEDLGMGGKREHYGSFVGRVEVKLTYEEGIDMRDIKMIGNAIIGTGLVKRGV